MLLFDAIFFLAFIIFQIVFLNYVEKNKVRPKQMKLFSHMFTMLVILVIVIDVSVAFFLMSRLYNF